MQEHGAGSLRFKARDPTAPKATATSQIHQDDKAKEMELNESGDAVLSQLITVIVQIGSSRVSVPVTRGDVTEARRYPGSGADAVRRAVGTALRDELGFDRLSRVILRLEFMLGGIALYEELVPEDFDELEWLVGRGGSCRANPRICGGMDLETRQTLLRRHVFDAQTPYDLLDQYMTDIQRNTPAPDSPPQEYHLAQALLDGYSLGQWASVAALTGAPGFDGEVSPSRMAVLRHAALMADELANSNGGAIGLLPVIASPPPWVHNGEVVGIRVNDVAPTALFPLGRPQSVNPAVIKEAVLRGMLAAIPGLASEGAYDRSLLESEIQVDGDTKELAGLLSVTLVIPTGSGNWIRDLLTGRLVVWPGSFVTLDPAGIFAEVALAPEDNRLIRALGTALEIPYSCWRKVLNSAFSGAYATTFALVRYTTSASTGKGKERTVRCFSPGEGDSILKVGMSVMHILRTRRVQERVVLGLGPVVLTVATSPCPYHVLKELVGPGADPPILAIGAGGPPSPLILLAPLPKDWLETLAGRNKAKRIQEQLDFKRTCKQYLGVRDVGFVGRREKSSEAVGLLLEFGAVSEAGQFLAACCAGGHGVHPEASAVLLKLFSGPMSLQMVFACMVPQEALATMPEKDFKALLAKARQSGPDNPV